jgi:hypothetical protein
VYYPFNQPGGLMEERGIRLVARPGEADVVVGERRRQLLKALPVTGCVKPTLLYTDEPSYDSTARRVDWLIPGVKRLHVMNVFTGDVFTDAAGFLNFFGLGKPLPEMPKVERLRERWAKGRGAAFITYRPAEATRRVVEGREVDLNATRIALALRGRERGVTDVFGSGFPQGVAVDASGWGNTRAYEEWWDVKHRVLSEGYAFNLCLENTEWPNYVTEKLWQAIRADCLPVYQGAKNGVARLFPENSYVEVSAFDGADALYDFLRAMSFEEFYERLRVCRRVYAGLLEERAAGRTDTYAMRLERMVRRLFEAANGP